MPRLSFETAKKLKEAELQWEPQIGDWYYHADKWGEILSPQPFLVDSRTLKYEKIGLSDIFAPRLDQLLAEIEKRGWEYGGWQHAFYSKSKWGEKYTVQVFMTDRPHSVFVRHEVVADTLEEAAAQALLWILEQEKGGTAG